MKKTFTLITLAFTTALILIQSTGNQAISNQSGAPAAHTGSPADNQTCSKSGCHSGGATASPTQIITSNVPAGGYVPGQVYSITATMTQSGLSKFGFQISPQSSTGQLVGALSLTNATNTKIVSTKYVTHTLAGTSAPGGTKTWSFNWTAPAAGTGDVTFYGAFNFTNSSNSASGDIIRTNTLTITEDLTTGIADNTADKFNLNVFPNPVQSETNLRMKLDRPETVKVQLCDITGKFIQAPFEFEGAAGDNLFKLTIPSELTSGVYQLLITAGSETAVTSLLKK
jgi:Secretion system C-terminal sorting domain/Reeler domain